MTQTTETVGNGAGDRGSNDGGRCPDVPVSTDPVQRTPPSSGLEGTAEGGDPSGEVISTLEHPERPVEAFHTIGT